jgi:hypothetical protein
MAWRLACRTEGFDLCFVPGQGIAASGVSVTDPDGWMELPQPLDVPRDAGIRPVMVRLALALVPGGPALVAEELRVGARCYRSLHALAMSQGAGWIPFVTQTVSEEIQHRLWSHDVLARLKPCPRAAEPAREEVRRASGVRRTLSADDVAARLEAASEGSGRRAT